MTPENLKMTYELMKSQTSLIALMPLEEFIQECENYETTGFMFMRPFDWSSGLAGVRQCKELASLFLRVKQFALKHDKEIHDAKQL